MTACFLRDLQVHLFLGLDTQRRKYGYVLPFDYESGGYFFTWLPTLDQTLNSLEADESDPPKFPIELARQTLRRRLRGNWKRLSRKMK